MAQGLLTGGREQLRDSLWFGYSHQSNWQLFNGGLSRSWNRTVLMAGFEKGSHYTLQAKLWKRMKEVIGI